MIVYRELSSLEQDLGFSAKTLYADSKLRVPDELTPSIMWDSRWC